jgi:hypothetical protein
MRKQDRPAKPAERTKTGTSYFFNRSNVSLVCLRISTVLFFVANSAADDEKRGEERRREEKRGEEKRKQRSEGGKQKNKRTNRLKQSMIWKV